MKSCDKGHELSPSNTGFKRRKSGVIFSYCKECRRHKDRARYKSNPESTKKRAAKWRTAHACELPAIGRRAYQKRMNDPLRRKRYLEKQRGYKRPGDLVALRVYLQHQRQHLGEPYIKALLKSAGFDKGQMTTDLLAFYRENLRLKRLIKQQKDGAKREDVQNFRGTTSPEVGTKDHDLM